MPAPKRGWAKVANARKYHYFHEDKDLKSLCNRYMCFIPEALADDKHDHSENCKKSKRKRDEFAEDESLDV